MKNKEEIKQLAESIYHPMFSSNPFVIAESKGYIIGYTQCQEDVDWELLVKLSKRYTEEDIREAITFGKGMELWKEEKQIEDFINSLNKQD